MKENDSFKAVAEFQNILSDYEETFGSLPPIPKCGSYSTLTDLMKEALIAKKPLTWEDVEEAFEDVGYDLA